MIEVIIALVVGVALGAWGFKRDPDAIERLAAQARQLGDRF